MLPIAPQEGGDLFILLERKVAGGLKACGAWSPHPLLKLTDLAFEIRSTHLFGCQPPCLIMPWCCYRSFPECTAQACLAVAWASTGTSVKWGLRQMELTPAAASSSLDAEPAARLGSATVKCLPVFTGLLLLVSVVDPGLESQPHCRLLAGFPSK